MAIPVLLIALITVADIRAPETIHLGPLLVVAPAITTAFAGYRPTALIAVLALRAQSIIMALQSGLTTNHLAQLVGLTLLSVFAVLVCFVRDRRTEERTWPGCDRSPKPRSGPCCARSPTDWAPCTSHARTWPPRRRPASVATSMRQPVPAAGPA
ncbi:hypothetical protein ACWEQU_25040 [Streptomyces nodosus]